MRRVNSWSLIATTLLGQSISLNTSQPTDIFADSTLSCLGTSTYTGYVPLETVTITVDGNYTYTGFSNDSIPTAPIFYTPPPPCFSTVVPAPSTTSQSLSTLASNLSSVSTTPSSSTTRSLTTWTQTLTRTDCTTITANVTTSSLSGAPYGNSSTAVSHSIITSCSSSTFFNTYTDSESYSAFISDSPAPVAPAESSKIAATTHGFVPMIPSSTNTNVAPQVTAAASAARSSVATVTVTKKTPVAPTVSNTVNQIAFPDQSDGVGSVNAVVSKTTSKSSAVNTGAGTPGAGTPTPSVKTDPLPPANTPVPEKTSGTGATTNGGNNLVAPSNSNTNSDIKTAGVGSTGSTMNTNPTGTNNKPPVSSGSNNSGTAKNSPTSTSSQGGGMGSIINSAFNSPWTSVGVSTSYGAASATVTLVNGVPVQVEPSSVYIGGSYVALPTGSSTAFVTINGMTFTVDASAVVGGSSTLTIQRPESVSYSRVQVAALQASTVTQNGVVVTIEPTVAIVQGKTYAIGLNAEPTTVTVAGQTVVLNSQGVVFASTTYNPAMVTAAAYVVSTVGGLVFSIDASQAIISGTMYRIGAGALNKLTTTAIDGTTVIFGPSGIILPSTTIAPTPVGLPGDSFQSTQTGSATARVVSGQTLSATFSGAAIPSTSRPPIYLSTTVYVLAALFALGTLPLSLLL